MRCLIVTLGGDAPGINSTVRAATRIAIRRNMEVFGAKQGWVGLLNDQFWKLKESDVGSIINKGGSILGSTDVKIPEQDDKAHAKIAESLKKFDLVIATGGLGSFTVLNRVYDKSRMNTTTTMFVPASVEGEFLNPDHGSMSDHDPIHAESIGADTAGNRAITAIDNLRDQAFHSRTVFIVECVGTKSNFQPLQIGTSCGAQRIYLPIHPRLSEEDKEEIQELYGTAFDPNYVDINEMVHWIEDTFEKSKRKYLLVILPSGVPMMSIRQQHGDTDETAYEKMITTTKPLELTVLRVAEALDIHFTGRANPIQVRHVLLDDLQRGGAPSIKDRMLGTVYGEAAVEEYFSVLNNPGFDTDHRGNLNLLAIDGVGQMSWNCFPREKVGHLFKGKYARSGGLKPLPYFRQARGLVSGYRPFATL